MESDGVLEGLREKKPSTKHIEAIRGDETTQVLRDQFLEDPSTRPQEPTAKSAQDELNEAMRRVLGLKEKPVHNPYGSRTPASNHHDPEQE